MIVDKNIHILHIVSGDLWAGAEVQMFTLAKTLHDNPNLRVSVVILNHGRLEQKLREIGIEVIVLDESGLNGFRLLYRLIKTIRTLKPDVIHTHRIKENIIGSIAARYNGNTPTLRTAHGASEHLPAWYHLPKHLILYMDRFCGRFMQRRIIAVSKELASILKKDYPAEKVHVIENGLDLETIEEHLIEKSAASTNDVFRVGIAGRLVHVKRVDIFIKTARYILDHYPDLNIEFHIYGDGPLHNELEQLNHELNTEAIVFFEGHCDDILKKLQEIDALLLTSEHEGLPMILLEAMALRIPVIASAVGGIPHLLDHGSCGILVSEHNASYFALAINQLAINSGTISDLIQKAEDRIKENYSAEKNAQAYYSQYISIIKSN